MGSSSSSPVVPVEHVDVERYMGTWFEIARLPNRFQSPKSVCTMAQYALVGNKGKVSVHNMCRLGSFDGKVKDVKGTATVVDKDTNAKLKVCFFWPFKGNYWVLDLAEDYRYAVVGEPSRSYLWILSRTPQMEARDFEGCVRRVVQQQGYDVRELLLTRQPLQAEGGGPDVFPQELADVLQDLLREGEGKKEGGEE